MTTTTRIKLYVALAVLVLAGLAYQAYGGFQRDPRDVTFSVHVSAAGRTTSVEWRIGPTGGTGSPTFAGHDWQHDEVLPEPGTYTLILTATVNPIHVRDSFGNTLYRGASATCKITSHAGTASNVGLSDPRKGCNVTKVIVVPPE
jgi:hypothetical protein